MVLAMFLANCKFIRRAAFFFIFIDVSGEFNCTLPQNRYKPSRDLWEAVKESPIGLAISEILRYKQTNRQTDIFYFVF